MSEHEARLQQIRDAAVQKLDTARQVGEGWSHPGIRVGDLLALPGKEAGAGLLEWAVIEAAPRGDWVVVPADLNPMAGSSDVVVPTAAACGPLTLRCGFATTVDAAALTAATHGGTLPEASLGQAQKRCRDLETGAFDGTLLQEEAEQESEYQDWLRFTIGPAAAALAKTAHFVPEEEARLHSAFPSPPLPRERRFPSPQRWRAAAAFFLTAGLSAALMFQWKDGQVAAQRSARLTAEQQHQQAIEGLQQVLSQQTEAARRDRAALEEALANRPEALPPPPEVSDAQAIVNPQLIWFQPRPDAERGTAEVITLATTSEWLTFVLETRHPRTFPKYRVRLRTDSGTEVWTSDALHSQGVSEIVFSLPASLVPPGRYRFQLEGLRGSESQPLEEFRFRAEKAEGKGRSPSGQR